MQEWKVQEWKYRHEAVGKEGVENAGVEKSAWCHRGGKCKSGISETTAQ